MTTVPGRNILFYCTRKDPDKFEEVLPEIFACSELTKIELPCSGRVGSGELLQALAAGYEKIIVLSCGEKSCIHLFGCTEAKKAMNHARKVARIAGVDTSRFIFIEADDLITETEQEI